MFIIQRQNTDIKVMSNFIKVQNLKKQNSFSHIVIILLVAVFAGVALLIALGVLLTNIAYATYQEPDKKWEHFLSGYGWLLATFSVVGGLTGWLFTRADRNSPKFLDPAKTVLVTNYDKNSYKLRIDLSLEKGTNIQDVAILVNYLDNDKKIIYQQFLKESVVENLFYTFQVDRIKYENRLNVDLNEITPQVLVIYYSNNSHWKLSSEASGRIRIKPPSTKVQSLIGGTDSFFFQQELMIPNSTKITSKESKQMDILHTSNFYGYLEIIEYGMKERFSIEYQHNGEIEAFRKLFNKVKDRYEIDDDEIFTGIIHFGFTAEDAKEETNAGLHTKHSLESASMIFIRDKLIPLINQQLLKNCKPLIVDSVLEHEGKSIESILTEVSVMKQISERYPKNMILPLLEFYKQRYNSQYTDTMQNWALSYRNTFNHRNSKEFQFIKINSTLSEEELIFINQFSWAINGSRISTPNHERKMIEEILRETVMSSFKEPTPLVREILTWQGEQ